MAYIYFPFNSIVTDGVPDRAANAESLATYLAAFFSNGVLKNGTHPLRPTLISGTTVRASVQKGAACINGKLFSMDEAKTMPLAPPNAANDRIDRIVLRLNEAERLMELAVLKGTPAADPVAPELTRGADVYELCLAEVTISPNSSPRYILKDTRNNPDLCGFSQIPDHSHDLTDVAVFKTLWNDGEWSSGEKTIAGSEDYKKFLIVMHDQGTVIPVYKHTDNGGIFIRGSNGYQSETTTDFEYYFGATLKGDVWTLVGCSYMYHESGGIHGKRVACSVKEVIGVY